LGTIFLYKNIDKVSTFSALFARIYENYTLLGGIILFQVESYNQSREKNYELVIKQIKALLEGESNQIANLSNASALLNQFLDRVNWVGFYLMEDSELVLGPFQGLPACVRIPLGRGVCGTSAKEQKTIRVEDVHQFPGHIACDAASQSEIVIPLIKDGVLLGVLDIDSPEKNRFDELDQQKLEDFVKALVPFL
jgi:GAF domain-containing protein